MSSCVSAFKESTLAKCAVHNYIRSVLLNQVKNHFNLVESLQSTCLLPLLKTPLEDR